MSLTYVTGNIFEAPEGYALCIPVNTRGVSGAGLALQAKVADRGWEKGYKAWLKNRKRFGGSVGSFRTKDRYYVVLATKEEWARPSQIEWVVQGLWRLLTLAGSHPVALPRLGCGKGGLAWPEVKSHIDSLAAQNPTINWTVYSP